ncbi:hypothetical protein SK128_004513, partial [Halocaridina rubra]
SQLEAARSSYQRTISSRDAIIASLKDELDQIQLSHQEALEKLQSELEDSHSQFQSQSKTVQDLKKAMEETNNELEASQTRLEDLEEKLGQATTSSESLTPQIETLTNEKQQLVKMIEDFKKEKEDTNKKIAMLEFNNEHNKNKVVNMELSNKDLHEKIESLNKEKEELLNQIKEGSQGYEETLLKEKEELEEKLTKEKGELVEKYEMEAKYFRDQLEGLTDIKLGFEKQIRQIEENNAEMHRKIGGVQEERDKARHESSLLQKQKEELKKKYDNLTVVRNDLDEEVTELKGTIATLEEKLETEENEVQTLKETINTLNNNVLNLQKQVEGLNETNNKLATELQTESETRTDIQEQFLKLTQMNKLLEEVRIGDSAIISKLKSEKEEIGANLQSVIDEKNSAVKLCQEQKSQILQLECNKRTLSEKPSVSTESANLIDSGSNQTLERTQLVNETHKERHEVPDDETLTLKQLVKDLQERLRLAEIVSGEVEEHRRRVRDLEAQLTSSDEEHRQQLKTVTLEAERQVAVKELECQQTIASAYDQQDSETSAIVKQHQSVLQEAQKQAQEKTAALENVVQDYKDKLKYEDQLASLNSQHEVHMKEVEATWKARAEKMVKQKETQLQEEMNGLMNEWNKERRELERLTQVAAAAFRSGTDSVELLKKQVSTQRRELEDMKINHTKEIGELKALLELKRRSRGGTGASGGGSGIKLGVSLEEAAEFEYLKNILYQYMLGKETQTLSKVLCAVVKFDSHQQQEIFEHEEQRQSLQREAMNGSVHTDPHRPSTSVIL